MSDHYCFIDGVPAGHISVADRGFNYGHGVFETMRLHRGFIPLWQYHRDRLGAGLKVLKIAARLDKIDHQIERCLALLPTDGMVKLIVTAGQGLRGYQPPERGQPCCILQWYPAPANNSSLSLQVCQYHLPANPVLSGIKHLNRLDQVMAASELGPGQNGLLLDSKQQVIESLSHNIFCRIGERWLTPALTDCGVAGVMRHYLMTAIFNDCNERVTVDSIPLQTLTAATEIFLCNAVNGIIPVTKIADIGVWPVGPKTQQLQLQLTRRQPCFGE